VLGHVDLFVRAKVEHGGTHDIKIMDIWYIPDLLETLISVNMLQDKGTKCSIDDDTISVCTKRDLHFMLKVIFKKGVGYVPKCELIAPQKNALAFFTRQS
jgi:hypothetical protein